MPDSPTIVKDVEKYYGMYVTTASFDSKDVLTASTDPREAYGQAVSLGYPEPVLTYIPNEKDNFLAIPAFLGN